MTNTPFSKQVEIVADFYLEYGDEYSNLLEIYDLGFPLAVAYMQGGIKELTPNGTRWIAETFDAICEELEIDKHGEYNDVDEMVELANEQG